MMNMYWHHKHRVRGFLDNARRMLPEDGEIHATHNTGHPFRSWEIQMLTNNVGLKLVDEAPLPAWDYLGYSNKRGVESRCDESFCNASPFCRIGYISK